MRRVTERLLKGGLQATLLSPPPTSWLTRIWSRQASPPYLIEAHHLDLAADVDARGADAENLLLLQPALGIDGSHRHGGRQGRGDNDGDNVEGGHDDLRHLDLVGTQSVNEELPWRDTLMGGPVVGTLQTLYRM